MAEFDPTTRWVVVNEPFPKSESGASPTDSGYGNPVYLDEHNQSQEHAIAIHNITQERTELWTSDYQDFREKTKVADEIIPGGTGPNTGDTREPADHLYVDGTHYVYLSPSDPKRTEVLKGTDITNLSSSGDVTSGKSDPGVFHDTSSDMFYLFCEGDDTSPSSAEQFVFESSSPDSGFTEIGKSLSLSTWKTGDPDIRKYDGDIWMWTDWPRDGHPLYRQVLLRATDFPLDWEVITGTIDSPEGITWQNGGDFDVCGESSPQFAFAEYGGADNNGVDYYEPANVTDGEPARTIPITAPLR